jgi:hypothetical protein
MLSKIGPAVRAAQQRFARPFRVRHQAGHVAAFVADAGNVAERTVRIGLLVSSPLALQYCHRICRPVSSWFKSASSAK